MTIPNQTLDSDEEPDNDNTDQDGDGSDDAIVDTTEAEKAKREEAIKKISQCWPTCNEKNTHFLPGKDLKKWKAPIYAFFGANPEIEFANDGTAEYLVYSCMNCGEKKKQGLKTQDQGSTGQ